MTTANVSDIRYPSTSRDLVRQGRSVLLLEAIVCLLGGIGAMIFPVLASASLEIFLGVLCLVIGILALIRAAVGGTEHRGSSLATGILLSLLGGLMLAWPFAAGLEALTLLLAAIALVRGFADLLGMPVRSQIAPGLQIISGLAGIGLGVLLLAWYPADALWAPGLLFGIQLIFFGMGLMALYNAIDVPTSAPPATMLESS